MRRIDMAVRDGQVSVYAAHLWTLLEQGCRNKKELAKWMGRSERTVERYLSELQKTGFAEVHGNVPYATYPQDDDRTVTNVVTDLSLKEIDHNTTCMTGVSPGQPPAEVVNVAERLCERVFADPAAVDNLAQRLWQVLRGKETILEWIESDAWLDAVMRYAVMAVIEFEDVAGRRKRNLSPVRDVYAYFTGTLKNAYRQAA